MTEALKGGSDLKARLANLSREVAPTFVQEWAGVTAENARRTAPNPRRPASRAWSTKVSGRRGGVYGAYWWIFVDRGTKAHDIEPKKKRWLKFEYHGETIFAKKTHRKRMTRRPFITRAAQEALSGSSFAGIVEKAWARRKLLRSQVRGRAFL